MKNNFLFASFLSLLCWVNLLSAQSAGPQLVGYWHNWNDVNAPYLNLSAVDSRYDVIEVAFAIPTSVSDMTMVFVPDGISQSAFIAEVQAVQANGKKVFISVGGANASIDLSTTQNKNAFISSMGNILDTYGFDGMDIDIESGNSILALGGSISAPANIAQLNLIDAIQQIMVNYRNSFQRKLLLSMAPETAYVQGGQSAFGGIWGGYLPMIDALRDSIDILQVQLYNSGTMYGIDGGVYSQGTADFIVAMTEALIQGFNTAGGPFAGLPPEKIAVGLPACSSAAGGGFADSATVKIAMDYLLGLGPQPGTYVLSQAGGYPNLGGMMTWSINWDAVSLCGGSYSFASNFESIFYPAPNGLAGGAKEDVFFFPNPGDGVFEVKNLWGSGNISVFDLAGRLVFCAAFTSGSMRLELEEKGLYVARIEGVDGVRTERVVVR